MNKHLGSDFDEYMEGKLKDRIHVVPVNDVIEHESSSLCQCEPKTDYINPITGVYVIVHNALDERDSQGRPSKIRG